MTTDTTTTTDAQSFIDDWMALDAERNRRIAELRPANKAALFDVLAKAGITRVIVTFDGEGDSGQIESLVIEPGTVSGLPDDKIDYAEPGADKDGIRRATLSVEEAIDTFVYGLLAECHGGWEDNEGSCGEFTFDVASRTIDLEFNWRVIEYDTHHHSF